MVRDKVRVGVVGAGELATTMHYPSLVEMDDVELAAVCDIDEKRRKEAASRFGAGADYADFRRMLEREKLDAVFTSLRPYDIVPVAAEVLRRGLPLFLEKPPGVNSYQTGSLAAVAEQNGTISFVGFNRRYAPLLVEAAALVAEKGSIDHVVATFVKHAGPTTAPYYDGQIDVLMSDAIHAVDMLRFLAGEVAAVSAVTRVSYRDQDEKYVALVRFESGATGLLNCHWHSGRRYLGAEIHGGGASAFVEIEREMRFYNGPADPIILTAQQATGSEAKNHTWGYFQEARAFIDCVKSGRRPANDLADSFKTMRLAERIYNESI